MPSSWPMAHANSSRTSSIKLLKGHISIPNWILPINPRISFSDTRRYHDLPSLITAGGMVIVPDPLENVFNSYSISQTEKLWRADPGGVLCYSSNPVIYGLSIYCIFESRLIRISLLDGKVDVILRDPRIIPAEKCAPLLIVQTYFENQDFRETVKLIWGLDSHILTYILENGEEKDVNFISHTAEGYLRTPIAINSNYALFTSKQGKIYKVNVDTGEIVTIEVGDCILSAPCLLEERVYFQAISSRMNRMIFYLDPGNEQPKSAEIPDEQEHDIDYFETFFWYPPVVFGQYVVTSDCFHSKLIRCFGNKSQRASMRNRFFAHQSISIGNELISISDSGLFRWDLPTGKHSILNLTNKPGDRPIPIGFPAVYADKLIIWCEDRLICHSII